MKIKISLFMFFLLSQLIAGEKIDSRLLVHFDFNNYADNKIKSRKGAFFCKSNKNITPRYGALSIHKGADISIGNLKSLKLTRELTLSVWIFLPVHTKGWQTILYKGSRKGFKRIDFMLSLCSYYPEFKYSNKQGSWQGIMRYGKMLRGGKNSKLLKDLSRLPVKKWFMLTAVYNSGITELYVNGEKYFASTRGTPSLLNTQYPVKIGIGEARGGGKAYGFKGGIDNLRIYNRALSSKDVKELYMSEKQTLSQDYKYKYSSKTSDFDPDFKRKLGIVKKYEKTLPVDRLKKNKTTCKIIKYGDIPRLMVNGKFIYSMTMIPSPYGKTENVYYACRDFAAAGVKIYSDIFYNINRSWWLGEGKYNFEYIDKKIYAIIKANPEALIFPRIKLHPPKWWSDANPDQMIVTERGVSVGMESMASEKWTKLYSRMLKDLITHMENMDYSGHIIGYQPAGGRASEWFCCKGGRKRCVKSGTERFQKVGAKKIF